MNGQPGFPDCSPGRRDPRPTPNLRSAPAAVTFCAEVPACLWGLAVGPFPTKESRMSLQYLFGFLVTAAAGAVPPLGADIGPAVDEAIDAGIKYLLREVE